MSKNKEYPCLTLTTSSVCSEMWQRIQRRTPRDGCSDSLHLQGLTTLLSFPSCIVEPT